MAKLPTVRLVHKRDPRNVRVLDQFYYATNLDKYRDFRRIGDTRGDASDRQVDAAIAEHDANEARRVARDADRDFHRADITVASAEMKSALTGFDDTSEGASGDDEEAAADSVADEPRDDYAAENDTAPRRRGRPRRSE